MCSSDQSFAKNIFNLFYFVIDMYILVFICLYHLFLSTLVIYLSGI